MRFANVFKTADIYGNVLNTPFTPITTIIYTACDKMFAMQKLQLYPDTYTHAQSYHLGLLCLFIYLPIRKHDYENPNKVHPLILKFIYLAFKYKNKANSG